MNCRFCNTHIKHLFVSLGSSPLANSYLTKEQLRRIEPYYPLDVYVCDKCFLVQLEEFESPQNIFSDYAYFSSYSDTWLKHTKKYVDKMIDKFGFNGQSFIVEIASNDGCLLQYFIEKGISVLGIEPAANVAEVSKQKGIPTEVVFFGAETAARLAREGKYADLLLGNNVLAHVPDLNDFVAGLKILLQPDGIITMEFPHLMRLMDETQFDTIYHEHFSYFSFLTVEKVFSAHRLTIFDVEELPTHGGSLRIYASHREDNTKTISDHVFELRNREINAGYADINHYLNFDVRVRAVKREILNFLIQAKEKGKTIVGYGAPAKGNTLLNYCGIRTDFIDYTVDRNPYKQGRYLPGNHIPIEAPDKIKETKPDYVFILPWNLKDEIMEQMAFVREWGGKLVIPIPNIQVI
ncbi:MAG: class I SAM-dependent methyltransferase [candidate division Zixibacteria bacterium]|nr:class I SAM-dependent methyltransferase [candidate division Zixibacteria bacterium]